MYRYVPYAAFLIGIVGGLLTNLIYSVHGVAIWFIAFILGIVLGGMSRG